MRSIGFTATTITSGTFPVNGESRKCTVIRLGSKLRIIDSKTDRSITCRGYDDLAAIRKDYPGSV
jgi:hypothetical protein